MNTMEVYLEERTNPILEATDYVQSLSMAHWEITLLLTFFGLCRWWFANSIAESESRAEIINFLRNGSASSGYKLLIGWILDVSDRWFLRPESYAKPLGERPAWTFRLYDRTLLLATAYPVGLLVIQWAISGLPGRLGNLVVLPGGTDPIWRFTFFMGICVSCLLTVKATQKSRNWTFVVIALSMGLAIAGVLAEAGRASRQDFFGGDSFDIGPNGGGNAALLLGFEGATTYVVAAFFVSTIAICARRTGALDSILIVYSAIIISASTSILLSIVYFEKNNPGSFPEQFIVVFLGLCAFGILSMLTKIKFNVFLIIATFAIPIAILSDLKVRDIETIFYTLIIIGSLAVVVFFTLMLTINGREKLRRGENNYTYLMINIVAVIIVFSCFFLPESASEYHLFLIVIPLINAIFDFGSIGLTRWALRRGTRRVGLQTLGYALFDLATAVLLFVLLAVTVVLATYLFAMAAGRPLLITSGEGNVFANIKENPEQYIWLYATFVSTLIPTFAHCSLSIWSFGPAILNDSSRNWMANTIETSTKHFGRRWLVLNFLSLWATAALSIPIILIVWIGGWIFADSSSLGAEFLTLLEAFSRSLTNL